MRTLPFRGEYGEPLDFDDLAAQNSLRPEPAAAPRAVARPAPCGPRSGSRFRRRAPPSSPRHIRCECIPRAGASGDRGLRPAVGGGIVHRLHARRVESCRHPRTETHTPIALALSPPDQRPARQAPLKPSERVSALFPSEACTVRLTPVRSATIVYPVSGPGTVNAICVALEHSGRQGLMFEGQQRGWR